MKLKHGPLVSNSNSLYQVTVQIQQACVFPAPAISSPLVPSCLPPRR